MTRKRDQRPSSLHGSSTGAVCRPKVAEEARQMAIYGFL